MAKYRAEIDGLRALAIIPVVGYHSGISLFSGGYVGVDIFFVISGYLITSIIKADIERGCYSITDFYARRTRRILPALCAVVIFTSITSCVIFPARMLKDYFESVLATSLFSSNIYFWLRSGYFDAASDIKPLLHTWSLAVEEQFYLVFPLIMMVCANWRAAVLQTVVCAVFIISLLASIIWVNVFPNSTFYLTPFRVWELLAGSILAFGMVRRIANYWISEIASAIGVALIVLPVLLYRPQTLFPGATAIPPCLGAFLIIWATSTQKTYVGKALASYPLVFIGLVSYSIYLWHWPILVYTKLYIMAELSALQIMAMLLVVFVVSVISWRFIEQPFRDPQQAKGRVLAFGFSTLAVGMAFGIAGSLTNGWPSRSRTFTVIHSEYEGDRRDRIANKQRPCRGMHVELNLIASDCFEFGDESSRRRIIVWGDSHAEPLASMFDRLGKKLGISVAILGRTGCAPLIGVYKASNIALCDQGRAAEQSVRYILDQQPEHLFLVGRWNIYTNGWRRQGRLMNDTSFLSDDLNNANEASTSRAVFRAHLSQTLSTFKNLSNITVVRAVPTIKADAPFVIGVDCFSSRYCDVSLDDHASEQSAANDIIDEAIENYHRSAVDPADLLCIGGWCAYRDGDKPLYRDDNHLLQRAALRLEMMFDDVIERSKANPIKSSLISGD